MSTKSQRATAAIIISSIFLSACSDVEGDKETTSVTVETNFNDSSPIEEEATTDYNIGPGNTIRNSEGKIIDPMNDKVVEPESTSEENILD